MMAFGRCKRGREMRIVGGSETAISEFGCNRRGGGRVATNLMDYTDR
jgi:hypothetical protein